MNCEQALGRLKPVSKNKLAALFDFECGKHTNAV